MRLDHLLSKEKSKECCRSVIGNWTGPSKDRFRFLVAMRPGGTPVPIPNTMVKTRTADGTALETMWESRWPPDLKENKTHGDF